MRAIDCRPRPRGGGTSTAITLGRFFVCPVCFAERDVDESNLVEKGCDLR